MATTTFSSTLSNTTINANQMYAMTGGNVPANARINSVSIAVSCSRNDSGQPGYWNNSGYKQPVKIYKTASTSSTLIATYKKKYVSGYGSNIQYEEEKTINNSSGLLGVNTIYWYWERTGDGTSAIFNASVTVTITVTYSIPRSVTVNCSPSGGGSASASPSTAYAGDQVTLSQSAATNYIFDGWSSSPALSISSNKFTMPDSNVTITAKYVARSTGSLNKTSFNGGETITLAISAGKSAFTHKYKLSFGAGMETGETNVSAGVSSVSIAVPMSWCDQIPNATKKTSGTLTLKTYSGSTLVGTYTITGLVFNVPASVVPTLGDITTSIIRTVNGVTYADVGDYYVQNHSAVRIQASATGARSSTIAHVQAAISGYSGTSYNKTQTGSSIDFTSGLLVLAGTITITVIATDSRGRTATKTATITVTAYNKPSGTLTVKRADNNGDEDPNGQYGIYELTKAMTSVGSNSWQEVKLSCSLGNESNPANSGNLLPSNRKTFNILQQYEITLKLQDKFETTLIKAILNSAKFIMNISENGNGIAFMGAVTKTPPAGKTSTFEIPGSCQIYIGNETLEEFIQRIAGS